MTRSLPSWRRRGGFPFASPRTPPRPLEFARLFSIPAKVDVAMMPSQEIHKSLVVRIRNPKQRQHLPVTSARALETHADDFLHLIPRNQSVRVRLRNRFPEISGDQFFRRPCFRSFLRKRDVVFSNERAGSRAHG